MDSTIVTMTLDNGATGNVDYKDCRTPTDEDLVWAARKYGFSKGIKFTITSVIGNKTKFVADIVNNKLIRITEITRDNHAMKVLRESVCQREMARLEKFTKSDFDVNLVASAYNVDVDNINKTVQSLREGIWIDVPKRYEKAMFNCVLTDRILDAYLDSEVTRE